MFELMCFRNMMGNANSSLSGFFDNFFNDDLTNMFNIEDSIKAEVKETDEAYLLKFN